MPTFKEICESVFDEANGRPITLSSIKLGKDTDGTYFLTDPTQRNVVRWVNELNLQIQQQMMHARFMHKRGAFLTTKADTAVYPKRYVREVDQHSLYAIKSGSTGRLPISLGNYDDWVADERRGSDNTGTPLTIYRQPDEKWLLDPTPNAIYTVYADWWREPAKFDEPDDEPLWDETYHDILKWKALDLWAAEYAGEGAGKILTARIKQMLPTLESAFRKRYMAPIRGAEPLI